MTPRPLLDQKKIEAARAKIAEIIQKIVPLGEADRAKLKIAIDHARTLGERYIEYLTQDRDVLESRNHVGAEEVASLLELDLPAIR
jgi:hypothetical protein